MDSMRLLRLLPTMPVIVEAFREADQRLLTQLGRNPTLEEILACDTAAREFVRTHAKKA